MLNSLFPKIIVVHSPVYDLGIISKKKISGYKNIF